MNDAPEKVPVNCLSQKSVPDERKTRPSPGVRVRLGRSTTAPFFALGGFVILDPVVFNEKESAR